MTLETYTKAVRKLIDLSSLDLSAADCDEMIETAMANGKSPKACADDLSQFQDDEAADRFMVGCHN